MAPQAPIGKPSSQSSPSLGQRIFRTLKSVFGLKKVYKVQNANPSLPKSDLIKGKQSGRTLAQMQITSQDNVLPKMQTSSPQSPTPSATHENTPYQYDERVEELAENLYQTLSVPKTFVPSQDQNKRQSHEVDPAAPIKDDRPPVNHQLLEKYKDQQHQDTSRYFTVPVPLNKDEQALYQRACERDQPDLADLTKEVITLIKNENLPEGEYRKRQAYLQSKLDSYISEVIPALNKEEKVLPLEEKYTIDYLKGLKINLEHSKQGDYKKSQFAYRILNSTEPPIKPERPKPIFKESSLSFNEFDNGEYASADSLAEDDEDTTELSNLTMDLEKTGTPSYHQKTENPYGLLLKDFPTYDFVDNTGLEDLENLLSTETPIEQYQTINNKASQPDTKETDSNEQETKVTAKSIIRKVTDSLTRSEEQNYQQLALMACNDISRLAGKNTELRTLLLEIKEQKNQISSSLPVLVLLTVMEKHIEDIQGLSKPINTLNDTSPKGIIIKGPSSS